MGTTGPGQPGHLLLDLVDILDELAIPYALIGAFAVSFHGVPRYTADADAMIWLKICRRSLRLPRSRKTAFLITEAEKSKAVRQSRM